MTDGADPGTAPGEGGWKAMALVDDTSHPERNVYHKGNDRVVDIYFASPDVGFIVTQGAVETAQRGGAVFKATGSAVTEVAFSGDGTGLRLLGPIDFVSVAPTPTGYVAAAYANDVIASKDGGRTFQIERNGPGEAAGALEYVLAYGVTSSGTTMVRKTGVVSTAAAAPGPATVYEDIWAPEASHPAPDPVPADQCQAGPRGAGTPTTRYSVSMSADRGFIAYTANPAHQPEICISTDGGRSFFPHPLTVPDALTDLTPTGVVFTSRTAGITWLGSATSGSFVKRTVDGGATWTDARLPGGITDGQVELAAGFFAPDGQHGWLAGYDRKLDGALLLATVDGGATWTREDGIRDAVAAQHGSKLYTGFALDAAHVWVGGDRGVVLRR